MSAPVLHMLSLVGIDTNRDCRATGTLSDSMIATTAKKIIELAMGADEGSPMCRQRRLFAAEFKRAAESLVQDQEKSRADACHSLDVGETALRRWVDQLSAGG